MRASIKPVLILLASIMMYPGFSHAFPDKPIHIIVPFAPGGVTDLVSRIVAQGMSDELGQDIIVENKPGASGSLGTNYVAKSKPDGHTLLMGNISTLAINAATFKNLGYDPKLSFSPVSMIAKQPLLVGVKNDLDVNSVEALIELAKRAPGKLNYGAPGSSNQLATEAFSQATSIRMNHVPYGGSGPALIDLAAGHIDVMIETFSSIYPFVQQGKIQGLAVTSAERSNLAPHLPTLKELGFPDVEVTSWQGIVAPAGTPEDVIEKLNRAVVKSLSSQNIETQLTSKGLQPSPSSAEEFKDYIAEEEKRWVDLAQEIGLEPK